MGAGWGAQGNSFYIGWDLLLRLPQDIICSVRGGLGVHMHPKSWHCQNWVDLQPHPLILAPWRIWPTMRDQGVYINI